MVEVHNSESIMQKILGFIRKFGAETDVTGYHVIYEGYIAGYQYHNGPKYEQSFAPGTPFLLKHEPENPFSDHAVAVYYNDNRIGFIPSEWSREIVIKMQQGFHIAASVAHFDPALDAWQRLQVRVKSEK